MIVGWVVLVVLFAVTAIVLASIAMGLSIGTTSTKGAKGAPGRRGALGATGSPGMDGATGADGADGMDGATGANGADGATGAAGPTGGSGGGGVQWSAPIHVSTAGDFAIPNQSTLVPPITYICDQTSGGPANMVLPGTCAEGQQFLIISSAPNQGVQVRQIGGIVVGYLQSNSVSEFAPNYLNHQSISPGLQVLSTANSTTHDGQYIVLQKLAAANTWQILYNWGFALVPDV